MNLPGAEHAIAEVSKLREYCLNPLHPRGRHKARVFAAALGISQAEADFLRDQLIQAARTGAAIAGEADEYGSRYIVDFDCARGARHAIVRSGWIVRAGEGFPRLTTCYVLSE
jgi:hypothetical protein